MATTSETLPAAHGGGGEVPRSVVFFAGFMTAMALVAFASYYPREVFPLAAAYLPVYGLVGYILAQGIWRGSRGVWLFNLFVWGGTVIDSIQALSSPEEQTGSYLNAFDLVLIRGLLAVGLVVMLFAPSLFRWVWKQERDDRPVRTTVL